MAETFGTGTPKDEDVVVLYKGESKQVTVVLPQQNNPLFKGVTKRCCLSWLTNSVSSYMSPYAGGGGVTGSQRVCTVVHMEFK